MKFIFIFLSIFLSIKTIACKCDTPTIEGSFDSADFVFIGDIYDVNETYATAYWSVQNALSKVKVEKIYKSMSDDFKSKEVTFFGQQFNSCDVIFLEKGRYLIFAYIDPDTSFFYTSLCLATKPMSMVNENDLKLLEQLSFNHKTKISKQNNDNQLISLELRTPDKIINELKLQNKQISEHNIALKTYLIIISVILLLVLIISVVLIRRK